MSETPRRALVVEGGGMRGSYAAGVLIGLHDAGEFRFDAVWATSSGAASSAYGVAGQREGIEIWRRHLHGRRLVKPERFFLGGNLIDLDYLVDEVFRRRIPLDVARLHAAGVPLHVPATDVATGRVRYFDLSRRDPFPVLRAAMSLPGAVRDAVPIDGRRYVDGGVVDQVPVERALAAGATDLTVVLTRPDGYEVPPTGRVGLRLATGPFPGLRGALLRRHTRYARSMAALRSPPRGVRVRVIRPGAGLRIQRWTTSHRRLLAAIDRGFEDANRSLAGPARAARRRAAG